MSAEGATGHVNVRYQPDEQPPGSIGLSANAVLGHFPDYVDAADELGAARFAVPGPVWAAWGRAALQWPNNREFLDESIRRGRFLTTTPAPLARPGSTFLREIAYLLSLGYPLAPTHRLELL